MADNEEHYHCRFPQINLLVVKEDHGVEAVFPKCQISENDHLGMLETENPSNTSAKFDRKPLSDAEGNPLPPVKVAKGPKLRCRITHVRNEGHVSPIRSSSIVYHDVCDVTDESDADHYGSSVHNSTTRDDHWVENIVHPTVN